MVLLVIKMVVARILRGRRLPLVIVKQLAFNPAFRLTKIFGFSFGDYIWEILQN